MQNTSDFEEIPEDVRAEAEGAVLTLVPRKSKSIYEAAYGRFKAWCEAKSIKKYNETILLAYFSSKSKEVKPSTLWSEFSMIKSMLSLQENIDIKNYSKLLAFLKRNSVGYRPKKSKVFSKEDIVRFLNEAPDSKYLLMKVVAIFGMAGACRREELTKMTVDDVEEKDDILLVRIPLTKTDKPRSFVITKGLDRYRKYVNLRNPTTPHKRLFVFYKNNKCSVQPVGINTFAKIPSEIAKFLNLPDPQLYTGHAFRRSSATLLADEGGDILSLKKHGGWKSSTVAEGYVDESLCRKIRTAKMLQVESSPRKDEQECRPSTSAMSDNFVERVMDMPLSEASTSFAAGPTSDGQIDNNYQQQRPQSIRNQVLSSLPSNVTFSNCSNCNINFHVKLC